MSTIYRRRKADGTFAETFTADIWVDGRKYEPLTLDTMMGRYWRDHAAALPSANSVKYHIFRLREIIGQDLPLVELSNSVIDRYVTTRAKMHVSHATINRELDVLASAYFMARDRWEHPVRPIRWKDYRFPVSERQEATLSLLEARQAIALLTPRSRDMADAVELTIYAGPRKNELETLTCKRVNLAERTMTVIAKRKSRQEYRDRPVFLNTPAVALLAERIAGKEPDDRVFDLTNARKHWEWVRAEIGRTDVRWHDLRHTHGTLLGKTTKDDRIIQLQLGHAHLRTTARYVHKHNAEAIEAVEAIPPLTERKVVGLRVDAEKTGEPPSPTTSKDDDPSQKP